MIKSDGEPAYIAGDLAYLPDKRARGFDLCIYMLGADHHGYIARLKAAAAAFGDDPDAVEVLIGQLVNLVKDGQPVRMSKRAGTVITLDDLVDAVGVDAARYPSIRSSVDSAIDIDLDLFPGVATTTRLLRPVRPRPAVRAGPQRRRARHRSSTHSHLELLEPRQRGRRCCARSGNSRGSSDRRPSCARRTGSRATSRTSPGSTTACTTPCRVMPQGDEQMTELHTARRAWLNGHPRCSPTAWPARRQRPGADVNVASRRPPARRRRPHAESPPRPQSADELLDWRRFWPRTRPASTGSCQHRRRHGDRPRRRVRHPAVRPRRGRPPRSLPGPTPPRSVRRRCLLRRQGLPVHRRRALDRRRGPRRSMSAPAASWRSRWPPASRPSGSPSTATTSPSPS